MARRELDRSDPVQAEAIIVDLVPDVEKRAAIVRAMAELTDAAAAINAESWSITVLHHVVRLNIGAILAFEIKRDQIGLAGEKRPETLALLEREEIVQGEAFRVLPNVYFYWFRIGQPKFYVHLQRLLPICHEISRRAAAAARGKWRRAHSPGLVTLLEQTLKHPLPFHLSTSEVARVAEPSNQRIVKIAASERGSLWEECLHDEFICVGWGQLGDLKRFADKQSFMAAFRATYGDFYKNHASTITRKANELWMFRDIKPGDLVVANRGTSEILAVGEVLPEAYVFAPERESYKQTVRVRWDTSVARKIKKQGGWGVRTIDKVTPEFYRAVINHGSALAPEPTEPTEEASPYEPGGDEPDSTHAPPLPPSPLRIYISRERSDRAFVTELATALQSLGHKILKNQEGTPVKRLLTDDLREADVVLVVLSSHPSSSSWVAAEFNAARAYGRLMIIPILLDGALAPDAMENIPTIASPQRDVPGIVSQIQHFLRNFSLHRNPPALTANPSSRQEPDDAAGAALAASDMVPPIEDRPFAPEDDEVGASEPAAGMPPSASAELPTTIIIPLKVFISHNHADRELAIGLAHELQSLGHDVFENFNLEGGLAFGETLDQGLQNSDVVIVLWSPNSVHSEYVISEYSSARVYAKQHRMLLLPVMLDDTPIPQLMRNISAIRSPRRDLRSLLHDVLRAMNRFAAENGPASDTPTSSPPPPSGPQSDPLGAMRFPFEWRRGGDVSPAPKSLVEALYEIIKLMAESVPAREKWIVEIFKARFGERSTSTNLEFAYTDLRSAITQRAKIGPLLAEGFWLGIQEARVQGASAPKAEEVNALFREHQFPYILAPPDIRRAPAAKPQPVNPGDDAYEPELAPPDLVATSTSLGPETDPPPTTPLAPPQLAEPFTPPVTEPPTPSQPAPSTPFESLPPRATPLAAPTQPSVPRTLETAPPPLKRPSGPVGRTVTLNIEKNRVRLFDGLDLKGDSPPAWERGLDVDWSKDYFLDAPGKACTLADAFDNLPSRWDNAAIRAFGAKLADLLFGDPIPPVVREHLRVVGEQRRLVLVLSQQHQSVPWEYLRIGEYFIAEQRLSIVRHVPSDAKPRELVIEKPRAVLFAYSNPKTRHYDGDVHQKKILTAIKELDVSIESALTCTFLELEGLLCEGDGQVFHYLGHGEGGGLRTAASLTLHGDNGQDTRECDATTLAKWVSEHRRDLVVLGSCFGAAIPTGGLLLSIAGSVVHASATPVVAMQMEVPQEFSTAFAARFYRELKHAGYDIEVAVFKARRAESQGRHIFGIPVLLTDARGLPPPGALLRSSGEEANWASFPVTALLRADEATPLWRASPVVPSVVARAAAQAIEMDRRAGNIASYPPPPQDRSAADSSLATLERSLKDDGAREVLKRLDTSTPVEAQVELDDLRVGTIRPSNDVPLSARLTNELCRAAIDRINQRLSLPDGLAARIVGELRAGNHVMLTGPVGTGKTSLAREVTEALGYHVHLETASADWTRFEVLGGFWPAPGDKEQQLTFKFRAGVFLEAVRANWRPQPRAKGETETSWKRVPYGQEHGVWLVLDELNRADMDRALGGIFTALESLRLRVPAMDADGRTIEIPIPRDFRVLATINIADRHFLFRLSDALKRRFAFVHVPVTNAWNDEWRRLRKAVALPEDMDVDDLRRFVALVRMLHPLGTALVQAALKFCATSDFLTQRPTEWPLAQAIEGAILPNLEDLRDAGLQVLCAWAESKNATRLAAKLKEALPTPLTAIEPELLALAELRRDMSPGADGDDTIPDRTDGDKVSAWIAERVVRTSGDETMRQLWTAITGLRQGAASH